MLDEYNNIVILFHLFFSGASSLIFQTQGKRRQQFFSEFSSLSKGGNIAKSNYLQTPFFTPPGKFHAQSRFLQSRLEKEETENGIN
jgi:hypothetical protein